MLFSSQAFGDRQSGSNVPADHVPPPATERSFADSLKKIVRRVLRTQSCRTGFEARVLDEARRLVDGHYCEMARDTLERLVVDQLLLHRHDSQFDLAVQGAGALCPATQLKMSNPTFTLQPA